MFTAVMRCTLRRPKNHISNSILNQSNNSSPISACTSASANPKGVWHFWHLRWFCACPLVFRLRDSPGFFQHDFEAVERPAADAAPLSGFLPFRRGQPIPGQQPQYVTGGDGAARWPGCRGPAEHRRLRGAQRRGGPVPAAARR